MVVYIHIYHISYMYFMFTLAVLPELSSSLQLAFCPYLKLQQMFAYHGHPSSHQNVHFNV